MGKSIAITKLYSFFYLFEDFNYSRTKLADQLSISVLDLSTPDYNISSEQISKAFNLGFKLSEDPLFGIRYGLKLTKSFSSVLGVLLASCKNIDEALNYFCKYEKVVDRTSETKYRIIDKCIEISMLFLDNNPLPQEYIEYKVAGFIAYLRNLTAEDSITSLQVNFNHSPLSGISEYEKILGCPVSFNNENICIRFSKSIMDMLIQEPNHLLKKLMINEAQKIMIPYKEKPSYANKVREQVYSHSGNIIPTLSEVANTFAISERQLQIHLKSEGFSFSSIINQYKMETALEFLKNPMNTVDEIAYILGFSERSSFDRAFKRWTKTTPIEYRSCF